MLFDWKTAELDESSRLYFSIAEAMGLEVVGEHTPDLFAATQCGNKGDIIAHLFDYSRPVTVMDRFLIAGVLGGAVGSPAHRSVHPYLARALFGLSIILQKEHDYAKEGSRIRRIFELTGIPESTTRRHIKGIQEFERALGERVLETNNCKAVFKFKKLIIHELSEAGIVVSDL